MKKQYFLPEEIRFTKVQVLFLMNHLTELAAGKYPEIETEPILPDGSGIAKMNPKAKRDKVPYKPNHYALRIAHELNERLKSCGQDGEIVKERFVNKKSVEEVCGEFDVGIQEVFRATQKVLKFISGKRKSDYKKWCKRRE